MKHGRSSSSSLIRSSIALAISLGCAASVAMAAPGDPVGDVIVAGTDFTFSTPPDVARNAAGEFVVTWIALDQGQSTLYGRLFAADGTPAGPAFVVSASRARGNGEVWNPKVAMDPAGDFVIVWESVEGVRPYPALSGSLIHAQRYAAGGAPTGAPILVAANGTTPDVAMDDDGDFTVAWAVDGTITRPSIPIYGVPVFIPGINAPDAIRVRRYAANGLPLSLPTTLASGLRGVQGLRTTQPIVRGVSVASDGAGNSAVGWLRDPINTPGQRTLEVRRVSPNGAARGPSVTVAGGDASLGDLQLAMNATGELAAIYLRADGARVNTYAANGDLAIADLRASNAAPYTSLSFISGPAIAVDALGTVCVAASSGFGEDARINLRLFNRSGQPLSDVVAVTNAGTFRSVGSRPALAVDGAGNPVVAYTGFRLAPLRQFEISAQRYSGR